jgi:hypothetical protein
MALERVSGGSSRESSENYDIMPVPVHQNSRGRAPRSARTSKSLRVASLVHAMRKEINLLLDLILLSSNTIP